MTDPDRLTSNQSTDDAPRLADGEKGVIVQRDRKTYAIAPHIPCGLVTPELLRRIADVAERYDCKAVKLTSAQRIVLLGLEEGDVDAAWNDLGMPIGAVTGDQVRSVRVCPGIQHCKRGQQDSLGLGQRLDARYHAMPMPGKLKMAVSGCLNQCTETTTKDIGVVGTRQGWDLWVGGCGGASPRFGKRIAQRLSTDQVEAMLEGTVEFYKSHARPRERLHRTLARVGMEVLTDALGLPRLVSAGEPGEARQADA